MKDVLEFVHSFRSTADFRFQPMENLNIALSLASVPSEVDGPIF